MGRKLTTGGRTVLTDPTPRSAGPVAHRLESHDSEAGLSIRCRFPCRATQAYDRAMLFYRGLRAVTNFPISEYLSEEQIRQLEEDEKVRGLVAASARPAQPEDEQLVMEERTESEPFLPQLLPPRPQTAVEGLGRGQGVGRSYTMSTGYPTAFGMVGSTLELPLLPPPPPLSAILQSEASAQLSTVPQQQQGAQELPHMGSFDLVNVGDLGDLGNSLDDLFRLFNSCSDSSSNGL